ASSARTRLIREAPSILRPIIARLPFGHSGKASQSKSCSRAFRSEHLHIDSEWPPSPPPGVGSRTSGDESIGRARLGNGSAPPLRLGRVRRQPKECVDGSG